MFEYISEVAQYTMWQCTFIQSSHKRCMQLDHRVSLAAIQAPHLPVGTTTVSPRASTSAAPHACLTAFVEPLVYPFGDSPYFGKVRVTIPHLFSFSAGGGTISGPLRSPLSLQHLLQFSFGVKSVLPIVCICLPPAYTLEEHLQQN